MRTICLTLLLLALSPWGHAQTLYKSVDANGKVVYSDRPPASGNATTFDQTKLPVSIVPGMPVAPPGKAVVKKAIPKGDVMLYMAQWCGYCKAAKAYLAHKQIAYREFDIDTPDGKAAFAQIGGRGVPVLHASGKQVVGYTAKLYDGVFGDTGKKP